MDKQLSLSALSDELSQVRTKKREFLAEIDRIVPWEEWMSIIKPYYYKGERGNKPYDLERMLRIYLVQNLYNLSDVATVAEVIDSRAFSDFCGVESSNQVPGNAQEIDHQVIRAPVDDGGGRAEQLEHWAGDKRADDHCNDGYDGGQCDAVANNDGELLTIFCAVTLCYQDAYACGDAHKKRKQKVEYGGGAADGRQRIIADIAAYDDGIRGVVKLLGQIADQHGDSKLKNALPGSAQSHIVRGEKLLQSCSE